MDTTNSIGLLAYALIALLLIVGGVLTARKIAVFFLTAVIGIGLLEAVVYLAKYLSWIVMGVILIGGAWWVIELYSGWMGEYFFRQAYDAAQRGDMKTYRRMVEISTSYGYEPDPEKYPPFLTKG